MSIADKITKLQTAKADIKAAIQRKGVTVPQAASLAVFDDYIDQIAVSDVKRGTFTTNTETSKTVTHGLGKVPTTIIVYTIITNGTPGLNSVIYEKIENLTIFLQTVLNGSDFVTTVGGGTGAISNINATSFTVGSYSTSLAASATFGWFAI